MGMLAVYCRHCRVRRAVRNQRGLCQHCRAVPEIRALYPSSSPQGQWADRAAQIGGSLLPAEATQALPGTAAKVNVLVERAQRGERLDHPDDATWGED